MLVVELKPIHKHNCPEPQVNMQLLHDPIKN